MKKIGFIIIIFLLIGIAGYFLWQKRHEHFFQGEEGFEVEDEMGEDVDEEAERILQQEDGLGEDGNSEESEEGDDEEDDEDEFESDENDYETPVVDQEDCNDECANFDDDDLEYCNEVCGLAENDKNEESESCDEMKKLERDVCFKQEAIDKKDISICGKISDAVLEEGCENGVIEEILDQSWQ